MDIGIALPQMGPEASPAAIIQIAQEAEQLGYAAVWAGERLMRPRHYVPYGYPPAALPDHFKTIYDPLETLSYVAAKTERIKLGTSVINAFFHVPVVLARRFATLDQFSQGRVIAGIGQGWMKEEFETANLSFKRRGNGFEDYILALRAAWRADPVHYEGRFYHIVESDIGPKPVQLGGPPLLIGAIAPAAIERAVRLGDGINLLTRAWSALEQFARDFPEMARKAGRDPQQMLIVLRSSNPVSKQSQPEPRLPLNGSLAQIRDDVQRLTTFGIGHIMFDLVPMPIHDQLRLLEKLRRVVDQ